MQKIEDMSEKPMSDDDVNTVMKSIANLKKSEAKEVQDLMQKYSNCITSLLVASKKITTDESELVELDRLKRLIKFVSSEERFIRSKDKIWASRDFILAKNADFFLKKDFSKLIKKDNNQQFLETLVEIIKNGYSELSDTDRNWYWDQITVMLQCIIKFKMLMKSYDYS